MWSQNKERKTEGLEFRMGNAETKRDAEETHKVEWEQYCRSEGQWG